MEWNCSTPYARGKDSNESRHAFDDACVECCFSTYIFEVCFGTDGFVLELDYLLLSSTRYKAAFELHLNQMTTQLMELLNSATGHALIAQLRKKMIFLISHLWQVGQKERP